MQNWAFKTKGSIIASLCFSDFFVFKNYLAEYDLSRNNSKYDFDTEFHKMSKDEEKKKVIITNLHNV